MEVPHPPGGFARGDRFERATWFFVNVVKVLAEMRVSVGVVNEGVLETAGFLNSLKPSVELFGRTHRRGQATIRDRTGMFNQTRTRKGQRLT